MQLRFEVQNVEMAFAVSMTSNELGQTLDMLERFTRGVDQITRGRVSGVAPIVVPLVTQELLDSAVTVRLGETVLKRPGLDYTDRLVWDIERKCYQVYGGMK